MAAWRGGSELVAAASRKAHLGDWNPGPRCVAGGARFHEKPVGPHPLWSYQLAFPAASFSHVVGWLALDHGALDVFVHPNTGDELRDHRDCALWLGRSYALNLVALAG